MISGFCLGSSTKRRPKISRKEKFALYLPPELRAEVENHYQEDGSHSLTAFIGNAELTQKLEAVLLSVTRLIYHMGNIFRDNAPPRTGPGALPVDRKLRRKMQAKRIAMGHKPDDHEEQGYIGPAM